jgi:putative aldouronate transport system substrate-binding protein
MKKNNKKLTSVLATVITGSLVLTACGGTTEKEGGSTAPAPTTAAATSSVPKTGLPLAKELATVKIATVIIDGQPASKDIRLWQEIEKQTNVHVDFQDIASSQWNEKKGLLFASNELPEAFIGHNILNDTDLINYGSTGQLIPLEKLIEEYAPNLNKAFKEYPDLKKQITAPDGHIYAIPSFLGDYQTVKVNSPLFVNKSWLDKLGLKAPTTTDEFEQMLIAFKTKDPDGNGKQDEIPYLVHTNSGYFSNLFGAFGLHDRYSTDGTAHITMKNGKAIYSLAQPEYKDAINYFHKLYAQGLIDKETFTQDSKSYNAKIKTVPRIVGVFQTWRSTSWASKPEEVGDYIAIGPLKGPKDDSMWEQYPSGLSGRGAFAITKASKNSELLMRWLDNVISDDNQMQMANAGRFGDYLEKTADGKVKLLRALNPSNPEEAKNTPGNASRINFMTKSNSERLVDLTAVYKEKREFDKLYEAHFFKEVMPNIFFSQEEAQQIATFGKDINTYANSMYAKWIMEGGVDKDWDGYLKKLNDMGLNNFVGVFQKALDRYNSMK